jgi:hypothetical protein
MRLVEMEVDPGGAVGSGRRRHRFHVVEDQQIHKRIPYPMSMHTCKHQPLSSAYLRPCRVGLVEFSYKAAWTARADMVLAKGEGSGHRAWCDS